MVLHSKQFVPTSHPAISVYLFQFFLACLHTHTHTSISLNCVCEAQFPARRPKNQIGQWHLPENGRSHTFPCAWIISATESIGLSFFSIFFRLQTWKRTSILDWISVANMCAPIPLTDCLCFALFSYNDVLSCYCSAFAPWTFSYILFVYFFYCWFFYRFVYYWWSCCCCCCCLLYSELFIMSYFSLLFNSILSSYFFLARSKYTPLFAMDVCCDAFLHAYSPHPKQIHTHIIEQGEENKTHRHENRKSYERIEL